MGPFIDDDTKRKFVFVKGNPTLPSNQELLERHFIFETLERFSVGIEQDEFDSTVYMREELHYTYKEEDIGSSTTTCVEKYTTTSYLIR